MTYNSDLIIEYLSSPEGLNNIVFIIILFAAINAIFITYALRNNFGKYKEENERRKIQEEKIKRLFPSSKFRNDSE